MSNITIDIKPNTSNIPTQLNIGRITNGEDRIEGVESGVWPIKTKMRVRTTRNYRVHMPYGFDTSVKRVFLGKASGVFIPLIDDIARDALSVEDVILRVRKYCILGEIDDSVLFIFRTVEKWMDNSEWDRVELLIEREEIINWGEDDLIALLSSTLPWNKNILNRKKLYEKARKKLLTDYYQNESEVDFILEGLI